MHFATAYKTHRVAIATLYAMIFWLAGCKDPLETTLPNPGNNATQQKSYLTFKSFDELYQTVDKLNKQSNVQQKTWDQSKGFTSLRQLFEQVIDEEALAYEAENKLFLIDPKANPLHQRSRTASTLGEMVIYDTKNGGVVLNLANPAMATVLNKQGIVCIDQTLYQFSYDAVKSTPKRSDKVAEQSISAMIDARTPDEANQIAVNVIRHKLKPINTPQARGGFSRPFSCESASGDPFEWKMIAYVDEAVWERTEYRQIFNYTVYSNYGYTPSTAVQFVEAMAQITVRTLKRGFWGAWYDRDSQQQTLSGSIKIDNSAPGSDGDLSFIRTDFPPGTSALGIPINGVGMLGSGRNYSVDFILPGPDSQRSSWNVNVYRYSNLGRNYTDSQRIIQNGSVFRFGWSGYNCNCDIQF